MQDTQTLKAKIITQLDVLPAESLELLAEFATFLRAKSGNDSELDLPGVVLRGIQEEMAEIELKTPAGRTQRPIRIISPRLVNREQIADFTLEVIQEVDDRL